MNPTTREQLINATQAFLKDGNICLPIRAMAAQILLKCTLSHIDDAIKAL